VVLANKIEENAAKHLICGCSAKKNHENTFYGLCVILKMDMKNVKILLNSTLKRGTSQACLKSLIISKSYKILS
jgi:hypothetical protein